MDKGFKYLSVEDALHRPYIPFYNEMCYLINEVSLLCRELSKNGYQIEPRSDFGVVDLDRLLRSATMLARYCVQTKK